MQLSPHKIDTTLVRYFVARTTRFNSCVYLYCYDPPIEHQSRGYQNQALIKNNPQIKPPSNLSTCRYPRVPPIDQAPDTPIKLPFAQAIPRPVEFPEDKTKTRPTEPNTSPSRSTNLTPGCSQNIMVNITRELQIYQ